MGKSETNPEHIVGTKNCAMGGENNPKAGTDETFTNLILARDRGSVLGLGTKRTASVGDARGT